ncbi:putative MFS family arabinose efflux permease [Terracoccus luteus]|uniref:Putative MFS family arabinose efflux permease n=1 Tax=Terracoccus luteus TaxID=53356 RepID=A0A495XWJ1_9MICO|nr:MFS transporter [Terracoccus luteus]RKT78950.1 putative MFS family arabinose efflux permease [Terracoccus luteus]
MTTGRARHAQGFWVVVAVFGLVMAFATLPTPLYPLYQQRDGFPTAVITLIFAAYGVGVMAGLYLTGHLSDHLGRRRVLLVATAVELVSAAMFALSAGTAVLLVARLVCGLGIGALTSTATAHLGELWSVARPDDGGRFAGVVAGAVNTGGLALGSVAAGLLTQWLPAPLTLPYVVWAVLIALALVALTRVPETVPDETRAPENRPPYRPQRVGVEPSARPAFTAAAVAAAAAFSVLGLFTSLTASFLGTTLHEQSRLLSGAVVFGVIGASALSQIALGSASLRARTAWGRGLLVGGLLLVAAGSLALSLPLFVVAGVLAGAGVGLVFNVALASAATASSPEHRGETLAGMFLFAYTGITVPVVVAGLAITWVDPRLVIVVYALVALVGALAGTTRLLRLGDTAAGHP